MNGKTQRREDQQTDERTTSGNDGWEYRCQEAQRQIDYPTV